MTAGGSLRWSLPGLGNGGWHLADVLPIPVIFVIVFVSHKDVFCIIYLYFTTGFLKQS